jgi:hypothetical protein
MVVRQPRVQRSPLLLAMQAFGLPVKFPPLGPMPTQSELWTHPLVHHRPLQVRPATQGFPPGPHGSPTPDSLQIGHFSVMHDSKASSDEVTVAGYACLHWSTHSLEMQPVTQPSKPLH